MISRLLLLLRPRSTPKPVTRTLTLENPHQSSSFSTNPHRGNLRTSHRRRKSRNLDLPPVSQSEIDAAVSDLPPRFTPSDLAAAISRHPDPRLALPLLSHAAALPRHRPDSAAFLAAVKKLGAARLYEEMHSAAKLAAALPLDPSEPLLNTLIYFYTEARMLSKAVGTFRRAATASDPAARPTARTYNLLFAALVGNKPNSYINHVYMETVRSLFRQMVNSGIAPDSLTLNFIIRGYVGSLHLNDALRIFHQMGPVYGCEPDEHTYSWLVHGLCSQGRTRNAQQLFDEARGKGLVVDGRACNSLVCALAIGGEVGEAVGMIWEMGAMGRAADRVTCWTVVEEMCRRGRVGDAMGLLRELAEKEMVDGRLYRELLDGIQEEYDDCGGDLVMMGAERVREEGER